MSDSPMAPRAEHRRFDRQASQHSLRPACSCGWVGIECPDEDSATMIFDKHIELLEQIWRDVPADGR